MKKLILFIITMLAIIFIVNENINLISNVFRIISFVWIYILAKNIMYGGDKNEYTRYKIHRKKTKRNICK